MRNHIQLQSNNFGLSQFNPPQECILYFKENALNIILPVFLATTTWIFYILFLILNLLVSMSLCRHEH